MSWLYDQAGITYDQIGLTYDGAAALAYLDYIVVWRRRRR